MTLRDYQSRALNAVAATSARRVCLVAPTGSGKTIMGTAWLTSQAGRGLWIVHRTELLKQSAAQLTRVLDTRDVGIVAPGFPASPHARVQVATVQTLLARDWRPEASAIVLDELHHYVAADWRTLAEAYPAARVLGLTATPERQDGKPLGDICDALVVAAHYSELVTSGHLVQCRAFVPPDPLDSGGLAQHPLEAYQRHADNALTFLFVSRIASAVALAAEFSAVGIPAAAIHQGTKRRERAETLERFAAGEIRVLASVQALTEGVDVPAARCAILARPFHHAGNYLQAAGRVLRPSPGKPDAILIDLVGAVLKYGLPTQDRTYSLTGRPIRLSGPALRQCPNCGFVMEGSPTACTQCGYSLRAAIDASTTTPHIYSLELREVFAGSATPSEAKHREYERLLNLARARSYDLAFVAREYKKLFGELPPWLNELPERSRRWQYERFRSRAEERGFKPGYAAAMYRETFGFWPPYAWRIPAA